MKYWHYLVFYLFMGMIILIDIWGVSYKEDCIRYGQSQVCFIDKPPTLFRSGAKGGISYFTIRFTLEDQGRITKESNTLYGGTAKTYGAPGYGFYRCYSLDVRLLSLYSRIYRWMDRPFVLSYGPVNVSLDGYDLE